MVKKGLWVLFVALCIIIGLYPILYFVLDRSFGLLSSKPNFLLKNVFWNIGFYIHIIFSGIALLIGWSQFIPSFREKYLGLHRRIGKIYVSTACAGSLAGFGIAFYATGGLISSLGFIFLAIIWFSSTLIAYIQIKKGFILRHQKAMIFSYAACFAAVSLRIWLPLLMMLTKNFTESYLIVAWLCWLPNMAFAGWLVRKTTLAKLPATN